MQKADIKSMIKDELSKTLEKIGEPRYRAVQVFKWLHRGIESFDEMSDIPKTLRDKLSDEFTIKNVKIKKRLESSIDDTVKYLYELWLFNLYLNTGRLPYGMQLLRFRPVWAEKKSDGV